MSSNTEKALEAGAVRDGSRECLPGLAPLHGTRVHALHKAACDAEREIFKKLLQNRVNAFNAAALPKGLKYPRYEGGFFVTVFHPEAEAQAKRMQELGVYVVPQKGALRVALCSAAEAEVPRLVEALSSK